MSEIKYDPRDVNKDGSINILDMIAKINAQKADANEDGSVNVLDIVKNQQSIGEMSSSILSGAQPTNLVSQGT